MDVNYLLGALAGAANGAAAMLLAYGGPRTWGACIRALGQAGSHRRKGGLALALGVLFGCYEVWLYGALNWDFWGLLLIWGYLLSASLTDVGAHEISVDASLIYAAAIAVCQLAGGGIAVFVNALLGAAAGALILGLPHLIRPASIGRGDVLLLAVCGLGTGFPGVIFVLTWGLLALLLVSVVQLLRKKVGIHSEMPLAPFLLFGALI